MRFFLRRVYRFVRKLIDYAPVLWRDWDVDYSSLFDLILFKLKRMEAQFSAQKECVVDISEMLVCIGALERLKADEYGSAEHDAHYKKWGINPDIFDPANYNKGPEELQELMAIFDMQEKCMERDLALLFDTLKKHVKQWWI